MNAKKETDAPKFIAELRSNGGFVSRACVATGVSKQTAYNWRKDDADFKLQWDEAIEHATEELEFECRRRAYEGVLEPVFYKGDECGTIRKYSDTLLIFQLKALNPRYRDRMPIDGDKLDADIERQLATMAAGSEVAALGEVESERVN